MTVIMVHTRNRPETPEGHAEIESTADRPGVAEENAQLPPIPNLLGGGPEQIPRFNLEGPDPVLTEVTPETRMMENMMRMMNAAMAQQQELFMKLLDDRDAINRRRETIGENVGTGSGGAEVLVNTEETRVTGGKDKEKEKESGCSYKTFLSCKPPEFAGTTEPIRCIRWLKEMETIFDACDCLENQWIIRH